VAETMPVERQHTMQSAMAPQSTDNPEITLFERQISWSKHGSRQMAFAKLKILNDGPKTMTVERHGVM